MKNIVYYCYVTIEGTISELNELHALIEAVKPVGARMVTLKNRYKELLADAIKDQLEEDKENFVFHTDSEF